MHNPLYFVTGSLTLVLSLSVVIWHYYFRALRVIESSWEDLVKKLTWVDPDKISRIALDLLEEPAQPNADQNQPGFDISEISMMIGGLEGLEIIERNSEVLIDLAAHLQRWYPEALTIAEELRLEARQLEWHVNRLRGAAKTGNLDISFPEYGQHAVAIYYRMTRELLAFSERANPALFAALQRTI